MIESETAETAKPNSVPISTLAPVPNGRPSQDSIIAVLAEENQRLNNEVLLLRAAVNERDVWIREAKDSASATSS